jgi:hypothetical protein
MNNVQPNRNPRQNFMTLIEVQDMIDRLDQGNEKDSLTVMAQIWDFTFCQRGTDLGENAADHSPSR